jgi:hypothetical protein
VPSLQLDELCTMLWDMIRYENFDVNSPYNRAAAQWAREQTTYELPLDRRALRDTAPLSPLDDQTGALEIATYPSPCAPDPPLLPADNSLPKGGLSRNDPCRPPESHRPSTIVAAEIVFVDEEVIEAEIVEADSLNRAGAEILFIE